MSDIKTCPLLVAAITTLSHDELEVYPNPAGRTQCTEDECGWWVNHFHADIKGDCALVALVNKLQ